MNSRSRSNILLVEDSPSDADVLQQTLATKPARAAFQFTWVERLDDALARLRQEAFDVLLLDLSLPDSSGPDTFRRAHQAAPRLPIVVLTGVNDESIGLAAIQEGVQDYLVKGQTDGRQIARAIRYAIERERAGRAIAPAAGIAPGYSHQYRGRCVDHRHCRKDHVPQSCGGQAHRLDGRPSTGKAILRCVSHHQRADTRKG